MADTPNFLSPSVQQRQSQYQFMDDLIGGRESVVLKGEEYLPRSPMENDAMFQNRLKHSRYSDLFNTTVSGISGLIFSKPITYQDVPKELEYFINNADSTGTHFDLVLARAYKKGLQKGLTFAVLDKANEFKAEPYTVIYDASQLVNYQTEQVEGKTVLKQITFVETITVPVEGDMFQTKEVKQYRFLYRGGYTLYKEVENEQTKEVTYEQVDEGKNVLNYIPCFILNLDENNHFMDAKPPLLEMGYKIKDLYVNQSAINYSLYQANVAIRTMAGVTEEEVKGMQISDHTIIRASDPDAKFSFWNFDSKGIEDYQNETERIREEIAKEGLNIVSNSGQVTATKEVLDNLKTQSKLNTMVTKLEDFANWILWSAYDLKSRETPKEGSQGKVAISVSLDKPLDAQEINAYSSMVAKSQLSLDSLWKMLQEKDALPSSFDPDLEKEMIETEYQPPQTPLV